MRNCFFLVPAGLALTLQASLPSGEPGVYPRAAAPDVEVPCAADGASDDGGRGRGRGYGGREAGVGLSSVAHAPSSDLYCIELFPAAGIEGVRGVVAMAPPASPFGVAVTRHGVHEYDLTVLLDGLPDPSTLGPYRTYVAWAMPPSLHPVTKLGVVRDGRLTRARVAYDQFMLLVTAEASAEVTEREGRLVLRGLSPSTRMQPHDLPFVLAGLLERRDAAEAGEHAAHARVHDAHALRASPATGGWVPPAMHPQVSMPAQLMMLRPGVSPYRVRDAGDAPAARPRETVLLADGDTFDLVAAPVRRRVAGREQMMLAFNGQVPGPLVHVEEGAEVVVRFTNRTDFPSAIHWHGIRLDNRFDGVPHLTQHAIAPDDTFTYHVRFPDAGLYWYHPHHREDVLQDLGLAGNLRVRPRDDSWLGPANREAVLMLDDVLVTEDGELVGHGEDSPTHALMGRFGNLLLVNGEPDWRMDVDDGDVVRLWLTNTSNTRVFNLSFDGRARMKVVASDVGRYAREAWVENVVIAPAERYVVDVRFEEPGTVALVNRVRAIDHLFGRFFDDVDSLGTVHVARAAARPDHGAAFDELRQNGDVIRDIERYRHHFDREPDRTLVVTLETRDLPFPLRPLFTLESVYRNPVEWSGTMPEMDWIATGRHVRWVLRDAATGKENLDIDDWDFRARDVVKVRLVNDRAALHAMQHPIHLHGQRFLVLAVNGVPNEHLVWKDTVLLPTGFVVDLLLDLANPGEWMMHCHIAEHLEAGMAMVVRVEG